MKNDKCINLITVHSWHPVSAGDSGRSLPDICAAHAAGHLVMSWLLDLHSFECSIGKGGDTSVAVCGAEPLTVHQNFLFTCAGIVAADNKNEIDDFLDYNHLKMPERFPCPSDYAAAASRAATFDDKDRFQFVSGCFLAISQLLKDYGHAYEQAKSILLENEEIPLDECCRLRHEWDTFFHLGTHPKSDVVLRMLASKLEWELAADCFIGWDLQPLPPQWKPFVPKRRDLSRGLTFWRYWKNSDEDHLYADLRADYASDHGGDNA